MTNRRGGTRVPIRLLVTALSGRRQQVGMSFNLAPEGIYLYGKPQRLGRVVSLEFKLPDHEESVWAKGEVRYLGRFGDYLGSGIAFTGMANKHYDWIHDWVISSRLTTLRQALGQRKRPQRRAA